MRGGYRGEEEVDQFIETMVLVLLCVSVSVLLYIRSRWVDRLRREEQQRQQQQRPVEDDPLAYGKEPGRGRSTGFDMGDR